MAFTHASLSLGSHAAGAVEQRNRLQEPLADGIAVYARQTLGRAVTVEFESLRDAPTQSGIAYPKFYVWARLFEDTKLVPEGAMRVAAINDDRFQVTDYVTAAQIVSEPEQLARIFPAELLGRLKAKADAATHPVAP